MAMGGFCLSIRSVLVVGGALGYSLVAERDRKGDQLESKESQFLYKIILLCNLYLFN